MSLLLHVGAGMVFGALVGLGIIAGRRATVAIRRATGASIDALADCGDDDVMDLAEAVQGIHRRDCDCPTCVAFGRVLHQAGWSA